MTEKYSACKAQIDPVRVMLKTSEYSLELSPHGRGMLFHQRTGEILSLNQTGTFIAGLLSVPQNIPEISRQFASRFGLDLAAAEEDVLEFIGVLREMGLLEINPTS